MLHTPPPTPQLRSTKESSGMVTEDEVSQVNCFAAVMLNNFQFADNPSVNA
jgi:hypothetical protein